MLNFERRASTRLDHSPEQGVCLKGKVVKTFFEGDPCLSVIIVINGPLFECKQYFYECATLQWTLISTLKNLDIFLASASNKIETSTNFERFWRLTGVRVMYVKNMKLKLLSSTDVVQRPVLSGAVTVMTTNTSYYL